jgi:hypothetical protein
MTAMHRSHGRARAARRRTPCPTAAHWGSRGWQGGGAAAATPGQSWGQSLLPRRAGAAARPPKNAGGESARRGEARGARRPSQGGAGGWRGGAGQRQHRPRPAPGRGRAGGGLRVRTCVSLVATVRVRVLYIAAAPLQGPLQLTLTPGAAGQASGSSGAAPRVGCAVWAGGSF